MKYIQKLILLLVLFFGIQSYSQCETLKKAFENELYSSKSLREYAVSVNNPDKIFDSWRILFQEKSLLHKDLTKIKEVETNLNAVKKAGSYSEWKKLANTVAKHSNWVEITNITSKVDGLTPHVLKVETKIDGSFFPKNKNVNGQSFQMEGFKGCHSENALKEYVQANGGTYSVKNKSIGQGGVYEGQPVINLNNKEYVKINGRFVEYEPGKLGGTSSFFPENWTNAKIKQEVEFALTNNHGKVNVNNPNDNLHFGFSSDGNVEIQFYLNVDGSIGSYFPKKR